MQYMHHCMYAIYEATTFCRMTTQICVGGCMHAHVSVRAFVRACVCVCVCPGRRVGSVHACVGVRMKVPGGAHVQIPGSRRACVCEHSWLQSAVV